MGLGLLTDGEAARLGQVAALLPAGEPREPVDGRGPADAGGRVTSSSNRSWASAGRACPQSLLEETGP